jgi:hypothetical protein
MWYFLISLGLSLVIELCLLAWLAFQASIDIGG